MFKKIMSVVMPFVILAFLAGCAQPEMSKQTIEQKEVSAPSITTEEKATLESLKPQVQQIYVNVLGEEKAKAMSVDGNTVSLTPDELNQIDTQVKALLKSSFGNGYEKFIIVKEKTISNNSSMKNYSYSTSDIIGVYSSPQIYYIYYNNITIYSTSTPYYAYNTAKQAQWYYFSFNGGGSLSDYYIPNYQYISIVDDVTPYPGNSKGVYKSYPAGLNKESYPNYSGYLYYLYTYGNVRSGYYVPIHSMQTVHMFIDPKVYNGSYSYTYGFTF